MSNQWTQKQRTPFTCAPVRELRQPVEVSSVNPYGYVVVTEHIYEAGAQHERDMRTERGHTEVK